MFSIHLIPFSDFFLLLASSSLRSHRRSMPLWMHRLRGSSGISWPRGPFTRGAVCCWCWATRRRADRGRSRQPACSHAGRDGAEVGDSVVGKEIDLTDALGSPPVDEWRNRVVLIHHVEFSARALEIGFNDGNELSGSMGAHGAIGLDLGVLRMKERPPRPQSHSDEVLSSPSANFHA